MHKVCSVVLAGLLLLAVRPARAVDPNHVDDFEDGTTMNWMTGLLGAPTPVPPLNIATGGPAGADDNYLLLRAIGGQGPGSRLVALNPVQWAGDYLGGGIQAIGMDVNNFSSVDLRLRLQFEDPVGGPPNNIALSRKAIVVPAGSGWMHVMFPVLPQNLRPALGSVADALSNTTILRIYHSPNKGLPPVAFVGSAGFDNIQAHVPEPSSLALVGAALVAVPLLRRRRK